MTALFEFDPPTALRFVAFVYALMAATVWVLLDQRHERGGLAAWCLGSAALAAGCLLYGLRDIVPDWLSIQLANLLVFASIPIRVVALRLEMRVPTRSALTLGMYLTVAGVFLLSHSISVSLRVQVATGIQMIGSAWLARTSMQVTRVTGLRSALWIGGAYSALAVALLVLLVGQLELGSAPPINVNHQVGSLVVLLVSTAAGLYGNFGYVGMSLERLRKSELAQAAALAHAGAQRLAAQEHAVQLQQWLDERDDLVRVLAHEVRQPLNNASAALQSARVALATSDEPADPRSAVAGHRVQRAQTVLGQIIGSLDNTLAATALLASPERIARHDVDIELLLQLSVGDLDDAQRSRVQIERLSPTRTAVMDAGLMRLALRNLLSNALSYSRPDSPVALRISDSDEPLALVFEVLDHGPGVAPDLAPRLFQRGERGSHDRPGHGLGLYVVLRVAELHGGKVEMQQRDGGGSIFRLWLTQGAELGADAARE